MIVEVSIGEAVDKATILSIKSEKIKDSSKLIKINKELSYLLDILDRDYKITNTNELFVKLKSVNENLWVIEDSIRDKEFNKEFDSVFIELARSVYITNDERFNIKKTIDSVYGSNFSEEKSYKKLYLMDLVLISYKDFNRKETNKGIILKNILTRNCT
jgi:hypothetical protein